MLLQMCCKFRRFNGFRLIKSTLNFEFYQETGDVAIIMLDIYCWLMFRC